ncbi:TrmH family RNA methyltransferase [Ramlibacter rhizophilus]|uniref:RNA methyltransferase n=1 Tax=Ramlibacter rhizophilus TaxID=1781167 RepID=A0A4Z0BSB7_9BURK|nr:RNA methyltransferase [Ramlibacter rhizophilus]TFZ01622.1 RNA methyltransferase [Ramlibacter rhizophilus]
MNPARIDLIQSRDNAWLKQLRRIAQDANAYRRAGQVWLEGEHLCRAALARGVQPETAVFAESAWAREAGQWALGAARIVVLPDPLFAGISGLESPASIGFVLPLAPHPAIDPQAPSVVLDRLQDAGNVGAILRCASAFGFGQVIALKGTAALWSPKVLRAGMGAHFGLSLVDAADPQALDALGVPLLVTSSHRGQFLHEAQARLPWPCAWVFGHEGQGVSAALEVRAAAAVRIVQPGGEESLNVATAAAICLHASAAGRAIAG